jgi:hypothetical protein
MAKQTDKIIQIMVYPTPIWGGFGRSESLMKLFGLGESGNVYQGSSKYFGEEKIKWFKKGESPLIDKK